MADATALPSCALCGGPLGVHDIDRGTCHDCRSPHGKIADLDIAIRASGDNPERISDWPAIRHELRKRFGANRSDLDLWQLCTDWLRAEGNLTPNEYLSKPLKELIRVLQHGFPGSELPSARGTSETSDEHVRQAGRSQKVETRRRGRKKANYRTTRKEADLAADWVRARDAGGYKADFARDNGLSLKEFVCLLARVAKRKYRSDK